MALYLNGDKMTGGTTVIANPQGTPTDELQTIQIGNTIYEIVGGSSGGSGGGDILIKDRDWTLITSSFGTTQLTNTYDYYLWIVICNGKIDHYKIIDSSLLNLETNEDSIIEYKSWNDGQGAYSNSRVTITASSVTLWDNNQGAVSAKLYGANAESGGSGSVYWKDITGTLTAGQTSITLIDSSILESSTFDFYTNKFGVNPTNVELTEAEYILQPLITQESELIGTITVSSELSSQYPAWKAFADLASIRDGWVANGTEDQWIAYEFPQSVEVNKITWFCADDNRRSIVSKIQYSSDGINWNDCTLLTNESCYVEIDGSNQATHWRLYFNGTFSTYTEPMISNLEFIKTNQPAITLTFEPQQTNLGVKVRVWNNN